MLQGSNLAIFLIFTVWTSMPNFMVFWKHEFQTPIICPCLMWNFPYQISHFSCFGNKTGCLQLLLRWECIKPSTNSYQTISIHEWIQVVISWTFVQFNTAFFHVHSINFLLNHSYNFFFSSLKKMVFVICRMIAFDSSLYLYCNTIPTIRFILFQFDILFSSLNSISSFDEVTHTCASFFTSGSSVDNLPFDLSIFQVEADLHKKKGPSNGLC